MLKVMLKAPVGGMISEGGQAARSALYLEAIGTVEETLKYLNQGNSWFRFTSPAGEPFLVPIENVAYVLEVRRNVN